MLTPSEAKPIGEEAIKRAQAVGPVSFTSMMVLAVEAALNRRGYYIIHANDILPQNAEATIERIRNHEELRKERSESLTRTTSN